MWDPFFTRSSNSDRSCLDPSPPNTILGLHDIPLGVKQQALRPSISPLLLLTLLYYDPMVQQPVLHPCPCQATQVNCGLSGKIKTFAPRTVCVLILRSWAGEGLVSLQGRLCVPRQKKIELASFAFSPPSVEPLCQTSFSRGCQMGRWKHLCGQS